MPVDRILNRRSRGQAVAALHRELGPLGAPIERNEVSGKTFGASTEASVREFQKRVGVPETGRVDRVTGGIMALAAMATEVGDRALLRKQLRNSVDRVPNSPEYAYWLARYAVTAGDYQTAYTVARRFPTFDLIIEVIVPIIEIPDRPQPHVPQRPDVPHPENFYTYRHELLPQAALGQLRRAVGELTVAQYKLDLGIPAHFEISAAELEDAKKDSSILLEAMQEWQEGIQNSFNRQYARAAIHYESCQRAVIRYFKEELALSVTGDLDRDLASVLSLLINSEAYKWLPLWQAIRWRRSLLSLKEIYEHDWVYPRGTDETYSVAGKYVVTFFSFSDILMSVGSELKLTLETRVIAPVVLLAFVFVPLARAEDNRLRRQFDAALQELDRLLALNNSLAPPYRLLCEFIEIPFIRLLQAETLQDKADAQYKARLHVREEDRSFLDAARADYNSRLPDPGNQNQTAPFQLLQAAKTYLDIVELFKDDGEYVNRINQGVRTLHSELSECIAQGDVTSHRFQIIGKSIKIPTIQPTSDTLPGVDRRVKPHESLVLFSPPTGEHVLRESNPRVYSLLLETEGRLLQLWFGFNYLGYRDDYVPPWRFPFLLERARYFCEHAKNAQREYLNFLGNAEREEFQELSASQNVEMEKSNVRIETARVDQVRLEVEASQESLELAQLTANNSQLRIDRYVEFNERMNDLESDSFLGSVIGGAALIGVAALGAAAGPGVFIGLAGAAALGGAGVEAGMNVFNTHISNSKAGEERSLELYNLGLAQTEADQSAEVAAANRAVAQAGLLVAGMQRAAALLRHEFAVQNLMFLRNRTLNAELWYRLSAAIRSVSETYLRYAIEMAFLAEQAYEFESDKRINVIRFDYDVSDLGDMLAGDFLLRDLDTLEQDLIVGQRIRQQQVRYVLSLAREFPEALQELRDNGEMIFSLRLEQLERRFPGLFNLRITSVEVLPVALMDPTRFSLELTNLGIGQVRLKAQPDTPPGTPSTSPLNTNDIDVEADDWLSALRTDWPVKVRVTGPETAVFSGLTRQDLAGLPSFFVSNQRGAFEGLAGASAWQVDLSMKGNRIVPDSLADLLITFTLSGYYDPTLRDAVDHAPRKAMATTTWFSAHQHFPDAFYQFNRVGRMDWQITQDFLALQGSLGELRNVAVLFSPSQKRPELGRLMCSYPIEFEVDAAGNIQMLRELPLFSLATNGLALSATLNTPIGSSVTFDFGDGTGLADSTALPHTYARPGRYDVLIRIAADGRLTEYRGAVVVSRQHTVQPPCIAVPALQATVAAGKITLQPSIQPPPGESLAVTWRIDNQEPAAGSDPVTFTLDPGRYVLRFSAIRPLTARFYSQQRYAPTTPLALKGFNLATNRTFDLATGSETTTSLNAFGQHVFGARTLSPIDRWTLELPLDDNLSVVSVSSTDVKQHDFSELADSFLALEYKIKDD